jgi:lysophospholipase L1-like esterase
MDVAPGRRALRLLVTLLTFVGLVGVTGPAWADDRSAGPDHAAYLALGDSVPFGFRGNQPPALYRIPQLFVGYPEIVGHDLRVAELNASCPGETTDSFIDATAQSNGCENSLGSDIGYRDLYPLHVRYAGSQLDYAVRTLRRDDDVRLVTLQLGANDGFLCQKAPQPYCPTGVADAAGLAALAAHVGQNLATILGTLRTEGHYSGKIVVVTYYALDYTDPVGLAGVQALNAAITQVATAAGAVVADGFGAFQALALQSGGSSITAGLVLPNDVHPTLFGQLLLARAVERAVGR